MEVSVNVKGGYAGEDHNNKAQKKNCRSDKYKS